ncbi:MAG: tRNA (N(6)-L-threonylcarbamoyladenosine(37)-C(2))-methylthiotransferase MtaB [Lentisphaeria bacterium]|nr:tRNA (N(6)-L-threonylcarbamoyladenosine(37)-C(2))-methylthiotransferase MtaB [Lentisphaeria bacterium]
MKRACIITLGCRLNHADTALLTDRLQKAGYALVPTPEDHPELIILNSCAVTAEAERKSRQQIRRLRRLCPGAEIVAAGCAAELAPEQMRACGADRVWSNPGKKRPEEACRRSRDLTAENFTENAVGEFPFRTRAFIKIQEGCDNRCAYCIVPTVRGPSRSRRFSECVEDCRHAVANGVPEIVLTGVNTCAYQDGGRSLADLIRVVAALPGEFRIRLSSTEPHPDDLTLVRLIAAPEHRLCRFLHLSMQHGSDRILRAMRRNYTADQFRRYADAARKTVPDIHLGTDFIVGFPGETDADFAELLRVAREAAFANIHAFAYSPRPGTPAAALPDRVPPAVVRARMAQLREVAAQNAAEFAARQRGKILPVILERESGGFQRGWSDNYLELRVPAGKFPLRRIVSIRADEKNLAERLQTVPDGDIL